MKCPRCQEENPPQAKFCLGCAAPLAQTCTNCGTQLPVSAKFCPECAHPVSARPATQPRFPSPEAYTPKHLAEKILTSKAALEGVEHIRSAGKETFHYGTSEKEDRWKWGYTWL